MIQVCHRLCAALCHILHSCSFIPLALRLCALSRTPHSVSSHGTEVPLPYDDVLYVSDSRCISPSGRLHDRLLCVLHCRGKISHLLPELDIPQRIVTPNWSHTGERPRTSERLIQAQRYRRTSHPFVFEERQEVVRRVVLRDAGRFARDGRRLLESGQPLRVWHNRHPESFCYWEEHRVPRYGSRRDEVQRAFVGVYHLLQRAGHDVDRDPGQVLWI